LRDEAPSLIRVTDDFVCYWHDEEGGPDLAAKTIPRARFARLFAPQIEHGHQLVALAAQPLQERIAFLVSRFGVHEGVTSADAERELLAIGEPAISALTRVLGDPRHGWVAAKLLGEIGVPRADVIDALRSRADELWWSTALGMLGDHAWLAAQGGLVAARGLTARLKAIATRRVRHALDYRPLERFLDGASEKERALVRAELEPGRSYAEIAPSDVDEALRGLSSEHPVVRWHAASRLGDRGFGARAGKKILPVLARGLADPDPTVRRLVVLSISYWKAAAAPYRGGIEALREDPDELVRRIVEHVLSQW
jgi:HEAT repeat protein